MIWGVTCRIFANPWNVLRKCSKDLLLNNTKRKWNEINSKVLNHCSDKEKIRWTTKKKKRWICWPLTSVSEIFIETKTNKSWRLFVRNQRLSSGQDFPVVLRPVRSCPGEQGNFSIFTPVLSRPVREQVRTPGQDRAKLLVLWVSLDEFHFWTRTLLMTKLHWSR